MDQDSDLENSNNNVLAKHEKMDYASCVAKIKHIYKEKHTALDGLMRSQAIDKYINSYFHSEEPNDVFEGFLHLILVLQPFSEKILGQTDFTLSKQVFHAFQRFLDVLDEVKRKEILCSKLCDEILIEALLIISNFKIKHLSTMDAIFNLKDKKYFNILIQIILAMIEKKDYPKAITWMAFFNVRDEFPLENIVKKLFRENLAGMIDLFIGDDVFRQKALIGYLDKLIGFYMRNVQGSDEDENQLISDHKKIEKAVPRYIKCFKFSDEVAPNTINLRCRNGLLYHHNRWVNKETTKSNLTDMAIHAMESNAYVREWYLTLLTREHKNEMAIEFAHRLGLKYSSYPDVLKNYCADNPGEVEEIKHNTTREMMERTTLNDEECQLEIGIDPTKPAPRIILINKWKQLQDLTVMLEDEPVIGIDAEWRPHFTTSAELVALLQIASSKAVFLVDVIELEQTKFDDCDWINFFEVLLCKNNRKIGYDIRNDIRVLTNTFPFFEALSQRIRNVICLYKLFNQIISMDDACEAIFRSNPPTNLSLSDVTKFFLGIELDKTERIGNWSQRPLRFEQKQYAALDAFCLVRIFRIVAEKLTEMNNKTLLESLEKSSQMKYTEKKNAINLIDGQVARLPKEEEDEFVQHIQEESAKILEKSLKSKSKVLGINDVKFAVDSMLFGIGRCLRSCGFDTRMLKDRLELIKLCEDNKDFIALSTGKAYKQIVTQLPNRALSLPVDTSGSTQPASVLVKYIMNELNIVIKPEDAWCRCVNCNKRGFVRVPRKIIEIMFYMFVMRHDCSWLEISDEEKDQAFESFRDMSIHLLKSKTEVETESYREIRRSLGDEDYILYADKSNICCECKMCAVDIRARLLLPESRGSPTKIQVNLRLKKDLFSTPGVQFFVCCDCGRIEFTTNAVFGQT